MRLIEEYTDTKEMMEHYLRSPYNNFQLTHRQMLRIHWASFRVSLKFAVCLVIGHKTKDITGLWTNYPTAWCTRCHKLIHPEEEES